MDSASVISSIEPSYEIQIFDDVDDAIRRAGAEERIILVQRGQSPFAVIPLIDLKLLLRLEDEELDRIDVEELSRIKESDEYHDRVSWDEVKMQSRL